MMFHGVTQCYMVFHVVAQCYTGFFCITWCFAVLHSVWFLISFSSFDGTLLKPCGRGYIFRTTVRLKFVVLQWERHPSCKNATQPKCYFMAVKIYRVSACVSELVLICLLENITRLSAWVWLSHQEDIPQIVFHENDCGFCI